VEPLRPSDPANLGDWILTARLGEGASGTTYLGVRGVAGSQQAAIKLIRDDGFPEGNSNESLQNEVDALSMIEDPFIAKLIEWNLNGNELWIATEFINGPTLDTKLRQTKEPLSELVWFQIAENIFHALRTIHDKGIIHRDIKPSNIIIGESGAKLIDFGISHIPDKTRYGQPGDFEGSVLFSAPENFSRKNAPEMDVFSAAATLAFAGKLKSVWQGSDETQITESMRKDAPDLEGLLPLQKEFLAPLFEKLASDRPTSEEVHKKALEYNKYLLDSHTKKKPTALKSKKSFYRRVFRSNRQAILTGVTSFLTIFALAVASGVLPNPIERYGSAKTLLNLCQTNLRDGSIDLAVASCTNAVEAGIEDANAYLARAFKAKGADSQAKAILQNCKDASTMCRSDFAYFFETGATALKTLNATYSEGDSDSAWRIGLSYQNNGEDKNALEWYEKGSTAKNPIADLLLATYYGGPDQKNFKLAITYAKRALGGDFSGNPDIFKISNPVERLIQDFFVKDGDSPGEIAFFMECANKGIVFCVSSLAETYLREKDYRNAEIWGKKGADINDGRSMWVLARVFVNKNSLVPGEKGDPSIERIIYGWYEKSAQLGEVKSMMALGVGHAFGVGGMETDFKQSCLWYQKSMVTINDRKGSYLEDLDDQKNYTQASQFFEVQNCQNLLLGENKAIRFATPSPSFNSNDCEELFLANSKNALEACKIASSKGDDRSTYYLAAIYDKNGQKREAETNYLKAIKLYKDDTKSMLGLVQIYLDRKDEKNYRIWVEKCANYQVKTTSGARCKLLFGIDQIDDGKTKEGIAYLTDAFEWGNISAGTFLAKYYETKKDNARAINWYEKAATAGDPQARAGIIALSYELGNMETWKKWITKSATEGNVGDIGRLAIYLTIAEKNYSEGKRWGLIGAKAGDAVSMFAAGYSYYKGDKNLVEAKDLLLKSAKLENILSARVLGEIYRSEKNFAEAITWYRKASSGDDLLSTYQLAMIYLNDMSNIKEACGFFRSTLSLAEKLKKSGDFVAANDQKLVDNSTSAITTLCT
jgi:serine/threonine protein kinase